MMKEEICILLITLKNFRNNSLSQGLDDEYSKLRIKQLFDLLNYEEKIFYLKIETKKYWE